MLQRFKVLMLGLIVFAAAGYAFYRYPPIKAVARGELGLRFNRLTGEVDEWRDSNVIVFPAVHELRVFSLRDRVYRPSDSFQSVEGLSLGVDITVRYALDAERLRTVWNNLPEDLGRDLVEPAVQSIMYKVFARYTVREIFSTRRPEIQQAIESELRPKLAADGVQLRDVLIGKVDLPPDYRRGMEALLAEELASEKMRYTLELKEKRVKETELEAEAARVRREKAAEAAAREQVIAARAQDEAMKHVLPFKQRQVEQRRLETEAYRLNQVGKANAEQMEREGALVSRHPLLIQKALADKLSDKIQVIIAPPPSDGGFIGATLLGGGQK